MTEKKLTQKEEAYAFAKEHGFTIGLVTIDRRTHYHAERETGRVESQGYSSLTVRMRKHLESIGEIPAKVFPKSTQQGAIEATRVRDQPKIVAAPLNWKMSVKVPKEPPEALSDFVELVQGSPLTDAQKTVLDNVDALTKDGRALEIKTGRTSGTPPDQAQEYISAFREGHPEITATWKHHGDPRPRPAHYGETLRENLVSTMVQKLNSSNASPVVMLFDDIGEAPRGPFKPWAVYAKDGAEHIDNFASRQDAVTCVRRFLSDNKLIRATVGNMLIRFERS